MAIALSLAYTTTPLAAGVKLRIFATPQLSAGISAPSKSAFRLVTVTAAAAASPANILAAYNALFGALVSGRKIFIRAEPITTTGIAGASINTVIVIT